MFYCFIAFIFFSSYSSHPVIFVFFNIMINFLYFFPTSKLSFGHFLEEKEGVQLGVQMGVQIGLQKGFRIGVQMGVQIGVQMGVQIGVQTGSRRVPYGVQKGGPEGGVHVLYRPRTCRYVVRSRIDHV